MGLLLQPRWVPHALIFYGVTAGCCCQQRVSTGLYCPPPWWGLLWLGIGRGQVRCCAPAVCVCGLAHSAVPRPARAAHTVHGVPARCAYQGLWAGRPVKRLAAPVCMACARRCSCGHRSGAGMGLCRDRCRRWANYCLQRRRCTWWLAQATSPFCRLARRSWQRWPQRCVQTQWVVSGLGCTSTLPLRCGAFLCKNYSCYRPADGR